MKKKVGVLLVFLLLLVAGCKVIPQNESYEKVAIPVISFNSIDNETEVTITSETSEAFILYTTDGSVPEEFEEWVAKKSEDSVIQEGVGTRIYAVPFALADSKVVRAVAYKRGLMPSNIVSKEYDETSENSFEGENVLLDKTPIEFGMWIYLIAILVVVILISVLFFEKSGETSKRKNPKVPENSLKQVQEYLEDMQMLGKTKVQIGERLRKNGWKEEQISYVFSRFK